LTGPAEESALESIFIRCISAPVAGELGLEGPPFDETFESDRPVTTS